jgi:two-component system sensor histidine kinase CreC
VKLGTRIFLCYTLIFLLCFYYPIDWMLDNLRTRYLEGVEDPLVDQANILASIVGTEMEAGRFRPDELSAAFSNVYSRPLSARIYSFLKTRVDTRVYITDAEGKVVFDSSGKARIGEDYLHWRNVRLTLKGAYGARTTRDDPADPTSSVLHVAAPVMVRGGIAGVLTVAKPTVTINTLVEEAEPRILRVVLIALAAAILLSFLVSIWMTGPIKRLTQYAIDVRDGKRTPFPRLHGGEIGEMGRAFEQMREALEGKKYIEDYVQTLTHEIKSPLSAIRGAAELLGEKMGPEQQARFLENIRNEANRIQDLVDRMLELTVLENLKSIDKRERLQLSALVEKVIESGRVLLAKKCISVSSDIPSAIVVEGDPFLLHQAISNLLRNAIDFSPSPGEIEISATADGQRVFFGLRDHGPGIPEYAETKIFEKFFSLQRPDTKKKSTGLGLNFVKVVAHLHKGDITLENCPDGGARAVLTLPAIT